jgi:hypothetical protein
MFGKMRSVIMFFSVLGILAVTSCRQNNKDVAISDIEKEKIVDEFREMNKRANEIYYRFPSPEEMFSYVNNKDLKFEVELLNPISNADNYIESKSQTINLGIYMADLGYITLFEKYKESVNYFDIIYELSEKLRVSTAFDKSLIKRIENNLKNVDSLKVISNDSYSYLIDYLVENDKEKTFAVISMGAYLEFLYLTLNLVGEYNPQSKTIQKIAEQKYVFDNLYFYFEEFKGDPIVDALFDDIVRLKAVIDKIGVENEKTSVTKSEDGKLVFGGGTKIFITREQFYELKDVSSEIRNNFVGSTDV